MATCSSILAWRIPWTEESVRLKSMGLQSVRHDCETGHTHNESLSYIVQSAAFLSDCQVTDSVHKCFKTRILIPCRLLGLLDISTSGFQIWALGDSSQGWGAWCGVQNPCSTEIHFASSCLLAAELEILARPPLCLSYSYDVTFLCFSCGEATQLVFRPFVERIIL